MFKKVLTIAVLSTLTSGCASIIPDRVGIKKNVTTSSQQMVDEVIANTKVEHNVGLNRVDSKDKVPVGVNNNWDKDRGNFSVSAAGRLSDVIEDTAKRAGYRTVMFVDGVDKDKTFTFSVSSVSPEFALKKMASTAGYVAIIDKKAKSITITDQAVYTFKLPSQVFNQFVQLISSNYSAGSSAGSSSGSIGGGSTTSGGFGINGKSAGGNAGAGIKEFIKSLVGKNAEVNVSEEMGIITVRSNAVALERLHQTLNKLAEVSSRRVSVEATFVEVSLGDQFQYGIDWSRVLNGSGQSFGINGGGQSGLAAASANYVYTFSNITSIVSALKKYTDVTIMSQPKIETGNRVPTTFFDGLTVPYLGSIMTTQQQTSTSTSGQVSYADDGVRLSFVPDIVSDSQVQFVLLPSLNSIGTEKTFDLGSGSHLTDFVRSKKEALLTVDLEDGQTAIIGGLRSSKASGNQTGIPGLDQKLAIGNNQEATAREVVLLLHANVVAGKPQETLFAESL